MLKMKKIISVVLMCAMVFSLVQITALGDYTEPTTAEKQFNEDFEGYQIDHIAYAEIGNLKYVNNGQPANGDYSNKTIYPNGTASVYEGNFADNQVSFVYGGDGTTKIYGGTKNLGKDDGWYGFYAGGAQQVTPDNRRISVVNNKFYNNSNKTQYLVLCPRYSLNAKPRTISAIHRNNVALDGYSYLTARVNLSIENADTSFGHAAIALTKNPDKYNDNGNFDILYFKDSGIEGKLDVYFSGAKVGEVSYTQYKYTAPTGDWYTIQYRIYNKGTSAMHKLSIVDDVNNTKIVDTEWAPVSITEGSEFDFNSENRYGIRFYAIAEDDRFQPRLSLDDISFHNGGYIEDFNRYNITRASNGSNGRIGNGPKGNRNITATYGEKGQNVYEGNMAKNVFVAHVLAVNDAGEPNANYDTVFGNIPQWQGYVAKTKTSSGSGIAKIRDMYHSSNDAWNHPVAVVSLTDRNQSDNGFNTKALVLRADTSFPKGQQTVYAGMENVDFSDKTTISAVVKIEQAKTDDLLKVQLTKGRDKVGAGDANYNDTSFEAKLDVFEMKNNNFYFGGVDIGDYEIQGAFRFEYTVNLTNRTIPKHELKIFNNVTNALVACVEESTMTLTDDFKFENNSVYGFRFVNDAPTTTGCIMTYIDDVKVKKTLPASLTGVNSINDAIYSAADNKVTLTADMAEAIDEASVFIFAVYDSNDVLQKVYKADYSALNVYENAIEITVEDDYASPNYYGRVFFWNSLSDLTPRTDAANVILK